MKHSFLVKQEHSEGQALTGQWGRGTCSSLASGLLPPLSEFWYLGCGLVRAGWICARCCLQHPRGQPSLGLPDAGSRGRMGPHGISTVLLGPSWPVSEAWGEGRHLCL